MRLFGKSKAKKAQELAEKARKLWESILAKDPSSQRLVEVMRGIPRVREWAWEILKQKAENKDLCFALRRVPETRERVGRWLLQLDPGKDDLLSIFEFVPVLRQEVWKLLATLALSNGELRNIMRQASLSSVSTEAGRQILGQNPNRTDLTDVIRFAPDLEFDAKRLRHAMTHEA